MAVGTAAVLPEVTFEEYLAAEVRSERRSEWVAGQVFALADGLERHDLMSGLVYQALAPQARRKGCVTFQQNRNVRFADAAYYPDVVVICPVGPAPDRLFERDLSIVVEVLSPSTERIDRQEKALAYPSAPSFSAYVLVDPDRRRIEVGRRDTTGRLTWQVHTDGPIDDLGIEDLRVNVDALYDELDRTART